MERIEKKVSPANKEELASALKWLYDDTNTYQYVGDKNKKIENKQKSNNELEGIILEDRRDQINFI